MREREREKGRERERGRERAGERERERKKEKEVDEGGGSRCTSTGHKRICVDAIEAGMLFSAPPHPQPWVSGEGSTRVAVPPPPPVSSLVARRALAMLVNTPRGPGSSRSGRRGLHPCPHRGCHGEEGELPLVHVGGYPALAMTACFCCWLSTRPASAPLAFSSSAKAFNRRERLPHPFMLRQGQRTTSCFGHPRRRSFYDQA